MEKKKIRLGLIGKDVSKSDSEKIHRFVLGEMGLEVEYERFSVSSDGFDNAMRRLLGDFDGFNVTIPYKRDVFAYLDEIVGDAFDFGAVNTVVSGARKGYNTDGVGFLLMLKNAGVEVKKKKVLVLGAGGAGRSTAAVLKKYGAEVYLYQRRREKLLEVCQELGVKEGSLREKYDILINATGVGMHDTEGLSPVEDAAFEGAVWAIDLIYVPKESAFLKQARLQGVSVLNGAAMLFYQAYFADCLYAGVEVDEKKAKALYEKYKKEKEGV